MRKCNKIKSELIQDLEEIQTQLQALKKSHENLQILFNVAPIGLCIVDEDGLFEYVNKFYCKLYGYTSEELIGKNFSMVIPPENKNALIEQHKEFMNNRTDTTKEFKVINKKQEQFTVIVTSVYFIDSTSPKRLPMLLILPSKRLRIFFVIKHTMIPLPSCLIENFFGRFKFCFKNAPNIIICLQLCSLI